VQEMRQLAKNNGDESAPEKKIDVKKME
jgi:hypothetical protein